MNKRILSECLKIARNNLPKHPEMNTGNYFHWTFVIQRNKIVEYATNNAGEPPKVFGYHNRGAWEDFFPKSHSELNAYRRAKGVLSREVEWEVVNIRLNKFGEIRMSRPCKCCYGLLKTMGCKRCFFTTDIGFAKIGF